jgi:hypothetical protein
LVDEEPEFVEDLTDQASLTHGFAPFRHILDRAMPVPGEPAQISGQASAVVKD